MSKDSPRPSPGQPGVSIAVRPEVGTNDRWTIRAPFRPWSVLDARTTHRKPDGAAITDREQVMLLILEGYCRSKCYCWTSNEELAAAKGCAVRTLQQILQEMQADGLIWRVLDDMPSRPGMTARVGIILLKRADPDLPVADPDASPEDPNAIPEVIKLMRAAIAFHQTRETAPSRARETAPSKGAGNRARIKTLSFKEDEIEKDGPESEFLQRQRPEPSGPVPEPLGTLLPPAEHPCIDEPPAVVELSPPGSDISPAEVAPAPPALTPGQEQFLATLDADRRRVFGAKSPEEQAALLAPFRLGYCRVIAAEYAARLTPRGADPLPPLPATTAELWGRLPGAPPHWVQHAAEALVRDFGRPKDRELRPAFVQVAELVWRGEMPPGVFLDAYRQAMGPKAENRGAVFNTALRAKGVEWEGTRP